MRKLDRYVWRELFIPFLTGTLAVTLMFQANLAIFIFKTFSAQAIPVTAALQYIIFKTPEFLNMTLPVGIALAGSLAISRLARESEVTAMRASGIRILRVIWPVITFSIAIAGLNFYIAEDVMPRAELKARKLFSKVQIAGSTPEFKSNVIVNLRNYAASFGTVQRLPNNTIALTKIMLIERPRVDEIQMTLSDYGEYRNGVWTIQQPKIYIFKGVNAQFIPSAGNLVISEPITIDPIFEPATSELMGAKELKSMIAQQRKQGYDTTNLQVRYYSRFSVPAACIIFGFVAPVFAIIFSKGGFTGILLSILLVFAYFNAFVVSTEIIGRNQWLTPMLAAWLPNIIFGVLGLLAVRRIE